MKVIKTSLDLRSNVGALLNRHTKVAGEAVDTVPSDFMGKKLLNFCL